MTRGQKIKAAREARGMTQEELGASCGTTKQTIFKYENDIVTNIPMDRIEQIAFALDISPSFIMGWDEPRVVPTPAPAQELSPVEASLVSDFRQLSPEGKEYILQTMAMARRSYSEKNDAVSDLEAAN